MTAPFSNATALEAEHRVIAICAMYPAKIDLVTADASDFVDPRWRLAVVALRDLHAEHGDGIDSLVLMDSITAMVPHLTHSDLTAPVASQDANPALIERYAEIVREEACKRRLRLGLSSVLESLSTGTTANEALTMASQAIREATVGQPDQALGIYPLVKARFQELGEMADAIANNSLTATGIPTGIDGLDKYMGGIQQGIVTLVAARPSMGKSALALNLANHASKSGVGVHKFSLEDTRSAYADRVLAMGSGVNPSDIRACKLNRGQLESISQAGSRLKLRTNWIVDDRSGVTAEEIVRCVRRNAASNQTGLVIVDYIGLLRGEKFQGTREMLTEAINCFGDAAKADNMAYLVLAQLNRGLESRDDKRPLLSDLKDCGTLEERAKAVLMIYRPAVYGDREGGRDVPESVMELILRKNSNGQTGTIVAKWMPERMMIK